MDYYYVARRLLRALALTTALVACGPDLSVEDDSAPEFTSPDAADPLALGEDAGSAEVEQDSRPGVLCVDITSQPAADHVGAPKAPPVMPRDLMPEVGTADPPLEDANCPEGTTPYYRYGSGWESATWSAKRGRANRLRLAQLARAKHRDDDGHEHDEALEPRVGSRDPHQYAVAYAWGDTLGVSAQLSVWKPRVENESDFSLAQLWVVGGTGKGHKPEGAETVEAGWQVSRGMYGDDAPRLFGYWTNDGYETGCYNLTCPGFVQVSSRFGLGARFTTYNQADQDRGAAVHLMIVKDGAEGDWWLAVGGHWIGYWPRELFTASGLRHGGELLEVGGEIHAEPGAAGHTKTQMGAGVLVQNARSAPSASVTNILGVNEDMELEAPSLRLQVTDRQCYGAALLPRDAWRAPNAPDMLFGGPGYSPYCQ